MLSLDEAFVDAAAPNADAIKNGRGLVLKSKFAVLSISEDESILFGECQGSGKEPYRCSCDFVRPDKPTHRCTCPSRQFPCKHCLGLMYAFVLKKPFKTAAVPEDVQAKREQMQARAEKKETEAEKPRQVNLGALAKKIKAQLAGIDVLERLACDLIRVGIGNMNAKLAAEMEQQAKQLGNAYLPGAQAALHKYTSLFAEDDSAFASKSAAQPKEPSARLSISSVGCMRSLSRAEPICSGVSTIPPSSRKPIQPSQPGLDTPGNSAN